MEIDTDAVRKAGNNLYPTVADKYAAAASVLTDDPWFGDFYAFSDAWIEYREQIRLYLTTSESHLNACGETLVKLADDYDATEVENSYNITRPYVSSFRNESE